MIKFLIENYTNKIETQFIVYKITNNLNGKCYIGQTYNHINKRIRKHISCSLNNPKCKIDKTIAKYDYINFKYEIIDFADSLNELNEKEIYWIKFYNSLVPNGYNLSSGGRNHITTNDTKEKLRFINKGKIVSDETKQKIIKSTTGNNNHFFGKKHSDESKKKMSMYQKGKIISLESRKKMSLSQKGRIHSEETKKKMSLSAKNKPLKEKQIYILDLNMNIITEVVNIHECSKYVNTCVRNIYDAISNHRLVKEKYYLLYKENFENEINILKK